MRPDYIISNAEQHYTDDKLHTSTLHLTFDKPSHYFILPLKKQYITCTHVQVSFISITLNYTVQTYTFLSQIIIHFCQRAEYFKPANTIIDWPEKKNDKSIPTFAINMCVILTNMAKTGTLYCQKYMQDQKLTYRSLTFNCKCGKSKIEYEIHDMYSCK